MIGKFKDDAMSKPLAEVFGLPPKMYSFLIDDKGQKTEKHRAKGIMRGVSRVIRHQQYVDQLQRIVEKYLPNH